MFQKRSEYQEALSLSVPQARPDDQILRCCLQQQLRMSQASSNVSDLRFCVGPALL